MPRPTTEELHHHAVGLDARPPEEIVAALAAGQCEAAQAVAGATAALCSGAAAMARSLRTGGRLIYAAAGSSGLMAAADALELGGTFSIPPGQVRILMAGGLPQGVEMPGGTEDETDGVARDLADTGPRDTVIAVSASGTTPYTLAAASAARARGASLIGIANNAGSPLLAMADHPVLLATPPELVAGSTRMGAGTAQKIALNILSTLMAVHLGRIHDGMMVDVVADNAKLRGRAVGMVATIAEVPADRAERSLADAGGHVKAAVLMARARLTFDAAQALLAENDENLRAALARV